jgi:hypothetical protein
MNPIGHVPNDIKRQCPWVSDAAIEQAEERLIAQFQERKAAGFKEQLVLNSNTISSDLKRQAFFKGALRAFKTLLLPLKAFSTAFYNVPLQGTDQASVPFYALQTASSTSFSGTYSAGNTATSSRLVTINNRYYQSFSFTSAEARRQPNLRPEELGYQNGRKLAVDVWTTIMGAVTNANYGAAVSVKVPQEANFDWVTDLKTNADVQQWPAEERSLIVHTDYDNALLKDDGFKLAIALAENMVREGKIPKALGFDYFANPNIPQNSEHLGGFIVHPSALLVAFAPIEPTEEVRRRIAAYEVVSDPDTGLSLEYRRWGEAATDSTMEVVECNFGFVTGNAAALGRITRQ